MLTKTPTKTINKINIFCCENCTFKCSKQSYWDRHIITAKHQKLTSVNTLVSTETKTGFSCNKCEKKYNSRVGLWKHNKICNIIQNEDENNKIVMDSSSNEFKTLTNLVLELVKSNAEMQKQMFEVCKNNNNINTTTNNNTTNNNNTNNNNKTFNLNFFLNEQCKDAMNLSDFVKSVQLTLPDLEKVDEQGYVNGMSNLIIAKLNELDIYKRPVHCSDAKRDTMHVKDEDKWEREDPEYSKLTVAVKDIEKKNFLLLNDYKEKYPDCLDLESIHNDKYLHMMMTLAASGKDEYKKVVKKMAKTVIIEKE